MGSTSLCLVIEFLLKYKHKWRFHQWCISEAREVIRMVKQRMSTADVAGEVACLQQSVLGMRVANVYDVNAKVIRFLLELLLVIRTQVFVRRASMCVCATDVHHQAVKERRGWREGAAGAGERCSLPHNTGTVPEAHKRPFTAGRTYVEVMFVNASSMWTGLLI